MSAAAGARLQHTEREHVAAMQAAIAGDGECPVCQAEAPADQLRDQLEQARLEVASVQAEEQRLIAEDIEPPKPKRRKQGSVIEVRARCRECEWEATTKNGMGLAVQHHDRTRHTVDVDQHMRVTYGDPETEGEAPAKPAEPSEIF